MIVSLPAVPRYFKIIGTVPLAGALVAALIPAVVCGTPLETSVKNLERKVSSIEELTAATANPAVTRIVVTGSLTGLSSVRLAPGKILLGADADVTLGFAPGADGIEVSTDNQVESLQLHTDIGRRALFNDTEASGLGRLVLRNLRTVGVVRLIARDKVRSGHVEAESVDIVAADGRGFAERPKGYGVEVIPGAFVIWNQQVDRNATLTADLLGLTAGRAGSPVRGSGIFVSGAGDTGGRLIIHRLETGAVYSDGGIAPGTSDRISGGVFVVYGAFADRVVNHGTVTTYGPNDMVLDNWGSVGHWSAEEKITSYGPSGIGFVNFGTVDLLEVKAPIETFGQGARGFNVYTGTVNTADFERIVTHGDGAIGIQISQPIGSLSVRRGIETYGSTGDSLVKGLMTKLSAVALSIKPGGSARSIHVAGGLIAHGAAVNPLEQHGRVEFFQVSEGFAATAGSD